MHALINKAKNELKFSVWLSSSHIAFCFVFVFYCTLFCLFVCSFFILFSFLIFKNMKSSVHKTKMNARLAIGQRADLFEANISANKINLLQGQSYTEKEYYNGSSMY